MLRTSPRRNTHSASILGSLAVLLATVLLPMISGQISKQITSQSGLQTDFGKLQLPLAFEPNSGQTDAAVRFMAKQPEGTLYFTPSEVVLSLSAPIGAGREANPVPGQVVRLAFVGSNPSASITSAEPLPSKVNYLLGNDQSRWHTDLPTYASITYSELYPGVSLTYEGSSGLLKGTYAVAAGRDPGKIRWHYSGAEKVSVDAAGNLQIAVAATGEVKAVTITERAPVAWQEIGGRQVPVQVRYSVGSDGVVGFALGSYDATQPLIIDPTIIYSTFLGGSIADQAWDLDADAAGNAYVTGYTASSNFPTRNAYQPNAGGQGDAFIAKFGPDGQLIYSTYFGGNYIDSAQGIAVDTEGNVYITGWTGSTNLPIRNAFQPTYAGGWDGFVTKLNAAGNDIVYSSYLGGSDQENRINAGTPGDIAVDAQGYAYITGDTLSSNFPVVNAFQPSLRGSGDVFVVKLNPSGSTAVFSTYLGGDGYESGWGITPDASGNAIVIGETNSYSFPTANAQQPNCAQTLGGGCSDTFVTKLNPTGSALLYSTYLGGNDYTWPDRGMRVAVDDAGNAYVTGITGSTNFPLLNPYQGFAGEHGDAFVTKYSTAGLMLYSTYLGGNNTDSPHDIIVNSAGEFYVVGITLSSDFPLVNPIFPSMRGDEPFITKFSANGQSLLFSTYYGGSNGREEWGARGIGLDAAGNIYVGGMTAASDFPTVNAYQSNNAGSYDVFVARISEANLTPTPATATSTPPMSTPTSTHTAMPTATSTSTSTSTATSTSISTSTPPQPTSTPISLTATRTVTPAPVTQTPFQATATRTVTPMPPTASATAEACNISFTDVPPGHTFHDSVRCLACRGVISGYADGTFRPDNLVTRGQLAKIVSNAANFTEPPGAQIFQDVPLTNPFYEWVNRLTNRGYMSGYSCGSPGEPCVNNRPYFRPFNNATRAQTSKIVANAARYTDPPAGQTFEDVPPSHPFYAEIQRLASRNIMGGYQCGSPGEPCMNNRPYFRPYNDVTRGQSAKIVANTFYPNCHTPAR